MIGFAIGIIVLGFIGYYIVVGVVAFFTELIPTAYKAIRYERHGICGECKQPYVKVNVSPADQMYGPDVITQDICPNGHKGLARGNRHFAEW